MRTSFTFSFTLLAAMSSMASGEIRETGTEGNMAVIRCPYTEGYEGYSKYFCKGVYKTCETLIKSNVKDVWTYKGRMSLQDKTERKMFVVTIRNLSMEDTGQYGCGIEKLGQDPFTVVQLTVIRAPKPPKTTPSTTLATTVSTHKAPEHIAYIGAGLAALVLLFGVFLFVLIKQKKASKQETETAQSSLTQHVHHHPIMENVSLRSVSQRTPSIQSTPMANRRHQSGTSSAVYSNIASRSHDSLNYATVNFAVQSDDLNYSNVVFVRESDSSHAKQSQPDTCRSSPPLYSTVTCSDEDTNPAIYATVK